MKKITLIFLSILLLAIASCSSDSSGSSSSGGGGSLGSSFRGGDDGLKISFQEDSPPSTIRDQSLQPFSIRLLIENEGEFDIPSNEAHVTLSGFDPNLLDLSDSSESLEELRGYKKQGGSEIPGGRAFVAFDGLKYTGTVSGKLPLTIRANICYPFETKSTAILCVSGDTFSNLDERTEICELENENVDFANSGGPVKIENVKQYPQGQNSVRLEFDVVHRETSSDANVYEPNALDSNCKIDGESPGGQNAIYKKDKVRYIVDTGISGLNCDGTSSGTGVVTLVNDKQKVICVQDTTGLDEFPKPITITLEYDYLDRISKEISIEHVVR